MRILLAGGGTGGHLYPGLAIAHALQRLDRSVEPFFVGAKRGIERDILPASGFPHLLLDLHPIYRARPWRNLTTAAAFAAAWRRLGQLWREERPAVAVGTGGYASGVPLAYSALHRVPTAIQEQNSFPGITTRTLARYAREIYLGYGEAAGHLTAAAAARALETGNPIEPPPEPALRPTRAAARRAWGFPEQGGHVLLIVGGSQGARALNDVVDRWIERELPPDLFLIWATGRSELERHIRLESERVRVRPYLSPIQDAYAAADFGLTRAGALTLAELCAWGIPAILVPLPTAAADHQSANAAALARAGAMIDLPQKELDVDRLDGAVRGLAGDGARLASLAASALSRARPHAADEIARRVLALARSPRARA